MEEEDILDDLLGEEGPEAQKMGFLEHMEELRQRLTKAILGTVIASSVAGIYWKEVFELIKKPAGKLKFQALHVFEPFMTKVKVSVIAGVFLAAPFIIYQLVAFIKPALKPKEKKYLYPLLFFFIFLFYLGVFFGYTYIMPLATAWLISQSEGVATLQARISDYISYASIFIIGSGFSFEVPIVIYALAKIGLFDEKALLRNWRLAIIVIVTAAAILTPDWSPVTMILFASPMVVLYFLSILLVRFF